MVFGDLCSLIEPYPLSAPGELQRFRFATAPSRNHGELANFHLSVNRELRQYASDRMLFLIPNPWTSLGEHGWFGRSSEDDVEGYGGNNDRWRGPANSSLNWTSNLRRPNDTLPFPGLTVIPAFLLSDLHLWKAAVAVPMLLFFAWPPGLFRGEGDVPNRS
jgi:hypothetical protein